jgi:hypothetical protein
MTLIEKARLLAEIIAWRLRWDRHDLDYRPGDTDCGRSVSVSRPPDLRVISPGFRSAGKAVAERLPAA